MAEPVSHEQTPTREDLDGTAWQIGFYEDILKRNPDYAEVLMLLAGLYTDKRMYAKGLRMDQRLAELRKEDPRAWYNLGCSYALVNQADRAFEALFHAVELGYDDVAHMSGDSDLERLRSDPRYAEVVARIRRRRS